MLAVGVARAGAGHFPPGHGTTGVWAAALEDRQATRTRAKMEGMGILSVEFDWRPAVRTRLVEIRPERRAVALTVAASPGWASSGIPSPEFLK
jgi:hypothetical protein